MKKIFLILTTLMIIVSLTLSFTGCKKETTETTSAEAAVTETTASETTASETTSAEKAEIVLWQDVAAYQETFENIASLFMKENPNINVKIELIPSTGWEQGLTSAFIAGNEPDISYIQFDFALMMEQKYAPWLNLGDYGVKDWPEYKNQVPAALNCLTYKDELYGLMQCDNWQGLFIRKSWMENVGWEKEYPYIESWQDLVDLAQKFTTEDPDKNGKNDTFGYEILGSLSRNYAEVQFEYMMNAAGEELVKDGKLNFNTEKGIAACQFMKDLVYKYGVVPKDSSTYTHVEFYRDVEGGKVGIGRVAPWNVAGWDKALNGDYEVVPYPPMEKGAYGYQSSVYRALSVSKNSKYPEAALKLVQFFLQDKAQEIMYKGTGFVLNKNLDYKTLSTSPRDLAFRVPSELVKPVYLVTDPNWTNECKAILAIHVQNVIANANSDPAAEMKAAEEEINKIFIKK